MRRAFLVGAAAALLLVGAAGPAGAQTTDPSKVVVYRWSSITLREVVDLLERRGAPEEVGGIGLLAHMDEVDDVLEAARADPDLDVIVVDLEEAAPGTSAPALAAEMAGAGQTWIIVNPTSGANDIGVVAIGGLPDVSDSAIPTLTSNSTRRDGVAVAEDLLPTMRSLAGLPDLEGEGAVIRPVEAPLPIALLEHHVANRRMSVPIQTAAGIYVTLAGLFGVLLLAARRRVPPWLSTLGAWIAFTIPPLAVALLFAGHLPTLTYSTVLPAVIGGTVLGTVAFVPVARARGTLAALAWMGAAVLAAFVLEAALGWTAALHTFLGGTQLDGGRFYGLPNVDIGLLVGASIFVAHSLRGTAAGVVLIAAVALFAGLPFAGANLGAAVTLAATAGLWWGLRGERGVLPTVAACVAAAATGLLVVLALNRFLPGLPTHITSFVEGGGDGVLTTVVHRLRTGLDLIARNPFAIVPVIGLPATLLAVLRPSAPLRASFVQHPGWRGALLTILWSGVVAYVANDTGAAALSMMFGTGLGALLFVSLRDRPWMMEPS